MNELTEKYLARMLEGAEAGLAQLDGTLEQINAQLSNMEEQRDEMVTAIADLKSLLGLEEEGEDTPNLKLVNDAASEG
tara:strand:- start:5 stop:238 length:234 start_codon:yes stop_codon:yes gene_type:complete